MDSLLNTSNQNSPNQHVPRISKRPPYHLDQQQQQQQQLPCPRCHSSNTKFCYYNNYNLSQPRHFCKACRRYWTRGGTLRNVPVGGATRKPSGANKRPRVIGSVSVSDHSVPTSSNSNGVTTTSTTSDNDTDMAVARSQNIDPVEKPGDGADVAKAAGSSGCWWSGILPLTGYGLGVGPGYENGLLDWPVMEEVGRGGGGGEVADQGCDTWQVGSGGEGGMSGDGEYLSWPELAISTPARVLK